MISGRRYGRQPQRWPSHTAYSYGSEALQEEPEEVVIRRRVRKERANQKSLRRLVEFIAVLVVLCYFGGVALSERYVASTNALIQLKQQEADLLDQNEALKMEVERLRSPERIAGIASKNLGLSTARSNIYVRVTTPAKK
ncbi:MAG: cell division protein FtsL [Acidaminococcus sp.]|jgi:cell division protein FtsL|nr:cell division protein FtsL [Acidaminococcus sp.]MCI2100148.1 cell division protein FtsL [Acidaminococcus sp.]MCI2114467.1 cell division protein FtsL [Acidaminococcus sp.]MCI2116402.1 cell division protein FtsL [Acidaminococcus sp.]